MGDPRVGDNGVSMANVMDDPRFWDATRNPGEPRLHFYNSRGPGTSGKVDYAFGGIRVNNRHVKNYWSGHFFYRAFGDFDMQQTRVPEGDALLWDFRVGSYDGYIMGVYGSQNNQGLDLINLNGTGNYALHPNKNFNYNVPLALPEVMGGGGSTVQPNPWLPYKDGQGNWIFGAPDGEPDGIIYAFSTTGWTLTK